MKLKILILGFIVAAGDAFAQGVINELVPVKDIAGYMHDCNDFSFSYDRIIAQREEDDLIVYLNSGYNHSFTMSPEYFPKRARGAASIRLPIEKCTTVRGKASVLKCEDQEAEVSLKLKNIADETELDINAKARVRFHLDQVRQYTLALAKDKMVSELRSEGKFVVQEAGKEALNFSINVKCQTW